MMAIIDRKVFNDRDKVKLYNQVLQQLNALSDKRAEEPVRVVAMNESLPGATGAETEAVSGVVPGEGCSSSREDTVPKLDD